jgi:hypothetical protein
LRFPYRILTISLYEARRFLAPEDQVHVLDRLAGGSFHQIVDGADDDGTPGGRVELESDIAEVGAIDGREVRQAAGRVEPHEFLRSIVTEVNVQEIFGGLDIARADIDGFENPPIDGKQVRGEGELRFVQTGDHQDFGDVAMIEHRIDGEVVGHLAETGFEAGFAPRAAHAGFGVADNSGGSIGRTAGDQRLNGEIGGRGITAGIRDQPRGTDALAAELGEAVDRFGEQLGSGVLLFVPMRIRGGVREAEGAAKIDDLGAGVEHSGREFHGDFRWRGQEDDRQAFAANGFCIAGNTAGLRMIDGRGTASLILAVFQEDGFGLWMRGQQAEEFGTAVAAEADEADLIFIHRSE